MKKALPILVVLLTLIIGCKPKTLEEKAKLTAEKFIECINTDKTDSAINIYPDCASFIESIKIGSMSFMGVSTYDNKHYVVTYNKSDYDSNGKLVNSSIQLIVVPTMYKDKDIQYIQGSKGFITFQPNALSAFLRKTGAIVDFTWDADIVEKYSDFVEFANYMIQNTNMTIEELAERSYAGNEYNSWTFTKEMKQLGIAN